MSYIANKIIDYFKDNKILEIPLDEDKRECLYKILDILNYTSELNSNNFRSWRDHPEVNEKIQKGLHLGIRLNGNIYDELIWYERFTGYEIIMYDDFIKLITKWKYEKLL